MAKYVLFSGHTLEGLDFIPGTMIHNSQGSSQVDRLTITASVGYLRRSQATQTNCTLTEEVTVTLTHMHRAHLADFSMLLYGLCIAINGKIPSLDSCIHIVVVTKH